MNVQISLNTLKAAAQFAATGDVRYYLNGVLIQATAQETRAVATDGHMLGAFREDKSNDVQGLVEFIIPADVIAAIKLTGKAAQGFVLNITEAEGRYMQFRAGPAPTLFEPVDGKFPDYRRVIPTHEYNKAVEPGQFNVALLARVDKAMRLWTGCRKHEIPYRLVHGPEAFGSARIETGKPGFIGAIMPWTERNKKQVTAWVSDTTWAKNGPNVSLEAIAA